MGGLVVAYPVWLVVFGPQPPQSGWINGWGLDAFALAAGVVCLVGGLGQRPGSYVPRVFALALICWMASSTILSIYALHGPPPPPPTLADPFGFSFIALCFVGTALLAREDRERLSPRALLDGGIAALGAGAVCAAFVLAHLPAEQGQSTLGVAVELVYPIGYVVLVLIVVGAATVAAGRSRTAWLALTAGFVLLAVPSALNAVTGPSRSNAVMIVLLAAWPPALVLIAASMWADPGAPDPNAVPKATPVWIPALACAAAIAVLLAATLRRVDRTATALAAASLFLVLLRAYSELRHETTARMRTQQSLAASEAGYRQVADEQAALRRVATLVARGIPPEEIFAAVAEEVAHVVSEADATFIGRYDSGDAIEFVGGWSRDGVPGLVGQRVQLGGRNVASLVFEFAEPARVDYTEQEAGALTALVRSWARSAAGAPIRVEGRLWGVMMVGSLRPGAFRAGIEHQVADFTDLLVTAIANAEARAELIASRARIVATADETRRRIERNLHDGVQQRLVSLALGLRSEETQVPAEQFEVRAVLSATVDALNDATAEVREIARGIHPAILTRGGLGPALRGLARRCPVPVEISLDREERLPEHVEVAAYYIVAEALTNAAKHAAASRVTVTVERKDGLLGVQISDDGVGGADSAGGSGLTGLRDRVEAIGGSLAVRSPRGRGTSLEVALPLAGAATRAASSRELGE